MAEEEEGYPHHKVRERYTFYCVDCNDFKELQNSSVASVRLRFDHVVMANVVQSAMDDILRYKLYHQDKNDGLSNCVKRSAYFTKWIVTLRPLYHDRPATPGALDKKDPTLLMNEMYAVQNSLRTIATDTDNEVIKLDPFFYSELLYDLHYRDLSGDALLTIYGMILDMVEKRPGVMKVFDVDPTL